MAMVEGSEVKSEEVCHKYVFISIQVGFSVVNTKRFDSEGIKFHFL